MVHLQWAPVKHKGSTWRLKGLYRLSGSFLGKVCEQRTSMVSEWSKNKCGAPSQFWALLLSPETIHQYIWRGDFEFFQKGMDFKQRLQTSLSKALPRPHIENIVGDTLPHYAWGYDSKKQSQLLIVLFVWKTCTRERERERERERVRESERDREIGILKPDTFNVLSLPALFLFI